MTQPTSAAPTEAIELKPCPFCPDGGKPQVWFYISCDCCGQDEWVAACKKCSVEYGHCNSESEAIAAWNTRPTPPLSGSAADLDTLKMVREACKAYASHFADKPYRIPPHIMLQDALAALDQLIARMEACSSHLSVKTACLSKSAYSDNQANVDGLIEQLNKSLLHPLDNEPSPPSIMFCNGWNAATNKHIRTIRAHFNASFNASEEKKE